MSKSRVEAVIVKSMESITISGIKALRIFDSGGRSVDIGAVGRSGMFFVFLDGRDFASGILDKNPGLFTADGVVLEANVSGVTVLDLVPLFHDGLHSENTLGLAYFKNFHECVDGTITMRVVFRSPFGVDERYFESDLRFHRFPVALLEYARGVQ
jgi:hypothetical protein